MGIVGTHPAVFLEVASKDIAVAGEERTKRDTGELSDGKGLQAGGDSLARSETMRWRCRMRDNKEKMRGPALAQRGRWG